MYKEKQKKILSVVTPVYNEEENIDEFYSRVLKATQDLNLELEIIYINDGSHDNTIEIINRQSEKDNRIAVLDLSRNFGKEIALTAGLDYASGDAVIVIDSDLQDPPEVIPELVKKWRDGNDVVNARRIKRKGEGFLKKITSHIYYRLLFFISDIKIPMDTGDFRLLNRNALDAISQLREKHRYMKGLFAWVGFKQQEIQYEREARYKGKTKWSFFGLFNLAFDGLTSFSILPLRLASTVGFLSALFGFVYGVTIVIKKIFFHEPVVGFTSLVVLVTFFGGIQLLSIGIIGEYIGRIFNETKNRPLYIVKNIKESVFSNKS